ncbi:ChaN family lipoprotein [Paracrocinitomix mangrovi]|uniref:ChaN family lipoprotein n=1 Tax=Paracrocinitomix mangrovi TaxID=2862509 RepID=UPI001C8D9705|nr:ChaN family lipoprotein [Paracrocinitomix mangrovi]UKN03373.1 ChaN family lipoprotein [Paracrocinitomix mangrovi]
MKKLSFLLFTLLVISSGFAQETEVVISKKDYAIFSSETGKKAKPQDIVDELKDADVIFFGEEHNDSIGHQLQLMLFKLMFDSYGEKAVLSMEMFDRDVQYIMDEYLQGLIKQSYFLKDSRKWSNYKDYAPMVEFAKEKGLAVICANAPFRYVNVATKHGLDGLMKLSEKAKEALAPLPYTLASGAYKAKLDALMGHDPSNPDSKPSYDMIPGQSLWDATMAYSIYQKLQAKPDSKILHLVGRFHVDEHFGIVERLKEFDPNIKVVVVSLDGSAENFPKVDITEYKKNGEYLIFSDPEVPKSY